MAAPGFESLPGTPLPEGTFTITEVDERRVLDVIGGAPTADGAAHQAADRPSRRTDHTLGEPGIGGRNSLRTGDRLRCLPRAPATSAQQRRGQRHRHEQRNGHARTTAQ